MKHLTLLLPATVAVLLQLPLGATQAMVNADAHVSPAIPTQNFGALPTLSVGNGSVALLQFDLSSIPAGTNPNTIAKAQLLVYVNRVAQAGKIQVLPLQSPFTEGAVTFSTRPSEGAPIAASGVITASNNWVVFDITDQVRTWVASPYSAFGVAIGPDASQPAVLTLDSKESISTSQPARLQLSIAGPTGAQGAQGIQGFVGPVGPTGPAGPATLQNLTTRIVSTTDLAGNTQGLRFVSCPSTFPIAIGGGCGHRDFNTAADDIIVNFSGPESTNNFQWRCIMKNTDGSPRAVQAWVICSK